MRLTQTFGEGVSYDDKRVFAEFARCAIENKDIVLKTKGETKRNYLYVNDAVKAILTVLEKGEVGHAYNAANEQTYCSIYEMAQMVAEDICRGGIKVRIESDEAADNGYAPVLKMNLSAEKLKNLGWTPSANLRTAFEKLIAYMKNNRS